MIQKEESLREATEHRKLSPAERERLYNRLWEDSKKWQLLKEENERKKAEREEEEVKRLTSGSPNSNSYERISYMYRKA